MQPPVIRTFDAAGLARREVIDADPDDEGVRALVGCGQNLPDQKIVIAHPETQTVCPPGRIGEIWVRGPSVAQGYWQQSEATERTFRARLKDTGEGPFLRTGDLGFLQDGELFVTGRLEGPDYRPRRELLSARYRTDRAAEPSAAAAGLRGRVCRGGRRPGAVGHCPGSGAAQTIGLHGHLHRDSPGRGRRARVGRGGDRAGPRGQRAENFQRQDPAARLPR